MLTHEKQFVWLQDRLVVVACNIYNTTLISTDPILKILKYVILRIWS